MSTFLVVLHVITCLILVFVVLIQSGKDGGIGMMAGGSSQTVFGSSGGANFFTKFTSTIAAIFMITSIFLTAVKGGSKGSIFDHMKTSGASASAPSSVPNMPTSEPTTLPHAPQDVAAPATTTEKH